MATIVLADDEALFRRGIRLILEQGGFEVVAEAADGNEAVRATAALCPDLVILDVFMPHLNGMESARQIHRASPQTKILLISGADRPISIDEIVGSGIRGFVLKRMTAETLVQTVHDVLRGAVVWTGTGASQVPTVKARALSPREREILKLIAEGVSSKDIASRLSVSIRTIESHRAKILRKLDVHDTVGLVKAAIRLGLLDP